MNIVVTTTSFSVSDILPGLAWWGAPGARAPSSTKTVCRGALKIGQVL